MHHETPAPGPIARGERHFRIDRRGIEHERRDPTRMRDEHKSELRGFVVRVIDRAKARITAITGTARDFVAVRQNDLVTVTVHTDAGAAVEHEIEAKLERVHAHEEIAELPAEAVLPVLVGGGELGEAPVGGERRCVGTPARRAAEPVQFPRRLHRRDHLHERRHVVERVLARVTNPQQRPELALQHLRHQLEHVRRIRRCIEEDFFVANHREHARKRRHGPVRDQLLLRMLKRPLPQEGALNRARCRPQDVRDDLRQLLLGVADMHQLVEAQQRRGPRLLLQKIRDPFRTPPDAMLVLVAWRPHAPGIRRPHPRLRRVRIHVAEPIKPTLNALALRIRPRSDVADPRVISRPNIVDDHFIVVGALIDQVLREGTTI